VIYFDTSYVARLYLEDPGWQAVHDLAASDHIACCIHGRAEMIAAFHRKFREGVYAQRDLRVLMDQFEKDCISGAFRWLPLSALVIARLSAVYESLPRSVPLRAADAVHLACAAQNGFKVIYSNDQHLLAAGPHFGLRGRDVI